MRLALGKNTFLIVLLFLSFNCFAELNYSKDKESLDEIKKFIKDSLKYEYSLRKKYIPPKSFNSTYTFDGISADYNHAIGKIVIENANDLEEVRCILCFGSFVPEVFVQKIKEAISSNAHNYSFKDSKKFHRLLMNNKGLVSQALNLEKKIIDAYKKNLVSIKIDTDLFYPEISIIGGSFNKEISASTPPFKTEKIFEPKEYKLIIKKDIFSISEVIDLSKKNSYSFELKKSVKPKKDSNKFNKAYSSLASNNDDLTLDDFLSAYDLLKKSNSYLKRYDSYTYDFSEPKYIKKLRENINNYLSLITEEKANIYLSESNNISELFKISKKFERTSFETSNPREIIKIINLDEDKLKINNDLKLKLIDKSKIESNKLNEGFIIKVNSVKRNFDQDIKLNENIVGTYQSGTIQKFNPEYPKLQLKRDQAFKDYQAALYSYNQNKQSCYGQGVSFFESFLCEALISTETQKKAFNDSNNLLLNSSPYIDEPIYESYEYGKSIVEGSKKTTLDISLINLKDKSFKRETLNIDESKEFVIFQGIHPKEENPPSGKINSQIDLDNYLLAKEIDISNVINLFEEKESKSKKINGDIKKFISAEINDSFLSNLLSLIIDFFKSIFNFFNFESSNDIDLEVDNRYESIVVVRTLTGLGTGFYVDNGLIITNEHVVGDSITVSLEDYSGKNFSGEVIKKDIYRDLALIRTDHRKSPLKFISKPFGAGDTVVAIGHPKGRKFSLTQGVISAMRNEKNPFSNIDIGQIKYLQIDAAINPGNSGGPLFIKEKVIGVNTWGHSYADDQNFAIHYSEIQKFLEN